MDDIDFNSSNSNNYSLEMNVEKEKISYFMYLFLKRVFDLVFSFFAIIFLIPLVFIIKIIYRSTNPNIRL